MKNDEQIRTQILTNSLHPVGDKIRFTYTAYFGDRVSITLVRKYLVFSFETVTNYKPEQILQMCATSEEEIDFLLAQNFETIWSVYSAHHAHSYYKLQQLGSRASADALKDLKK